MSFVVLATWHARRGSEEIVANAIEHLIAASRNEPGNLCYQPFRSAEDPSVFRFFEVYTDEDAFLAHGASAHFEKWGRAVAIPLLENRVRDFYSTIDEITDPET